jgi:hypothetical protein
MIFAATVEACKLFFDACQPRVRMALGHGKFGWTSISGAECDQGR